MSAFYSKSADNFLEIVEEIESTDGWRAVALALLGDVASLAYQVHGDKAQQWLDAGIARTLDRIDRDGSG